MENDTITLGPVSFAQTGRSSSPLSSLQSGTPGRSSPPVPTWNDGNSFLVTMGDNDPSDDDSGQTSSARRYRTTADKLQAVTELLQQFKWSMADLLHNWVKDEDIYGNEIIVQTKSQWRKPSSRKQCLAEAFEIPELQSLTVSIVPTIIGELDNLINTPYFGAFDHTSNIESLDFTLVAAQIQDIAPTWHVTMTGLLRNQRSHWGSYNPTPQADGLVAQRLFMITSMVCHSRAKQRSNFMCSMLDMYLMGSGVKRRVLEVLAGLGICHSYAQANRLMRTIAENAKTYIATLASNPQAVVVYDNYNFLDTVRDERLGHKASMKAMTTAAIVICPNIPPGGLLQSMHNPTLPLLLEDIFTSPGICGDDVGPQITRSIIVDAIRTVHSSSFDTHFPRSSTLFQMPVFQRLNIDKTRFWQLGAIHEDEGSIKGTYAVHDRIFLEQFKLKAQDPGSLSDDFTERLWLVHGDQLTSHHIRSVKAEQSGATRLYDSRKWLLAQSGQEAHHCIEADIITWGRSRGARDNTKYHIIAPLVAQSFAARVLALFYAAMQRRGYISQELDLSDLERLAGIDSIIAILCPDALSQLIEDVRLTAFTLEAWNGSRHSDKEFTTMCRMLQEVELFLTIRQAIRVADIGLLRRLVDPLIIYFLGASQWNYGHEMLYYRWNLTNVNTPELQHAILASGIVNWVGQASSHKPIDLSLEHLNGSCKIEMKCYKNSTHDTDVIFDRVCLTNTWVRLLRTILEGAFGEEMSGAHTTTSTELDIFTLARNIYTSKLAEPRQPTQLASLGELFESENIIQIGMERLAGKVNWFNQYHIGIPGQVKGYYPLANIDNEQIQRSNEDDEYGLETRNATSNFVLDFATAAAL